MDNQEIKPAAQKEQNNRRLHATYLIIIFLLAGLCGYLSLEYKELKTIVATHEISIVTINKEKDDVEGDLKELKEQYAMLETSDQELNAELQAKRAQIDSLLVLAEKHKGDAYYIAKLKKETSTLREIMKGYIVTIDSLNQLNGKLIAEKQEVLGQLSNEKTKTKQVEDEKDKLKTRIDRAAVLSTMNVKSTGIKQSRGGKKDTETNKASKVDKIRVTFDVADNDLTIAGPHPIYVRIITPDAQELTQERSPANQFSFGGTSSYFAAKKTIDYQNQPMTVLVLCPKAKEEDVLMPGKYIIELYSDQVMIGTTTLVLE
ncbi:MAG: hypothetical protein M3R17_02680 [Bacteroidota bacterium]|nr:hypothetical protein [Bacteroidota bacterium]